MEELTRDYRKVSIIISVIVISIIFVVALFFIKIHFKTNEKEVLHYTDNSELSYKVWLRENEYYDEKYVEQENQYISNLIDNIEADFKYEFGLQEKVGYDYDYGIVATATVSDSKTGKTIYEFSESIVERKKANIDDELLINEKIEIDYNKYNELIEKFVTQYELKSVDSNLKVKMDVNIAGESKKFEKPGITVMGLTIPLTENTVSIDTNYEALNAEPIIYIENNSPLNKTWLYVGSAIIIVDVILLIALIIYARKTETEEDKYKSEVRKIVNTYDSYISRIQDEFNMEGYQILKVASFTDLLEIRDTMHVPIIMLGNEENLTTCFMIPAPNNILYFFSIGVTQYALPSGDNENNTKVSVASNGVVSEEESEKDEETV